MEISRFIEIYDAIANVQLQQQIESSHIMYQITKHSILLFSTRFSASGIHYPISENAVSDFYSLFEEPLNFPIERASFAERPCESPQTDVFWLT